MKIAIPAVLILAGVVGLITMGILQGAIPEVGVAALQEDPTYHGTSVRLLGVITEIEGEGRPIRFTVRDMGNPDASVPVVVDGIRPDLFKVDADVAVIGVYDRESGRFEGTKIFTKCPSKYEATDETGAGGSAYGETPQEPEPQVDPVPSP